MKEKSFITLTSGGAIAFDNTLWNGDVLPERNINDPVTN
jgi:hypothetical protein